MRRWLCLLLLGCAPAAERPKGGAADSAAPAPSNAGRTPVDESRPAFETEIWQGEGRPVFEVAATGVRLHTAPHSSAPLLEDDIALTQGARVAFDSTRLRTVVAGALRSIAAGTIAGRHFGRVHRVSRDAYHAPEVPDTTLRTAPGDTVEFLQHRGEGTCFVRVQDAVLEADPCPTFRRAEYELLREPVLEWWIRAIPDGGRAGWLLVSDSTARVVNRQF